MIAHPLNKLLRKDAAWEWSDAQETAFLALKKSLINRPILAIFNQNAELELHTDATKVGVGSMLLQRVQGSNDLKPVAYYSRQTSPEEKICHSYELETLAVICSLKKFRVYLLGKTFKIVTDCSALHSTFQKRDLIPRIARWCLLLQEFDCSIEYRDGAKIAHVDALSRNPVAVECSQILEQAPMIMAISDEDWLLTLQLGDTELKRIKDILSNNIEEKELQYIKESFVISDNKLFRYVDENKEQFRWVVPKGARWQLCKMSHDDMGHLGLQKTLDRIKRTYWLPKMNRFVKKYVGACIDCAYAKKSSNTREGLLHPIPSANVPFHTLHIDHVGPFVRSKRGHTHILVIVDSFTKFVFIKSATKGIEVDKERELIGSHLFPHWIMNVKALEN
ncbi:unnamed protein product [Arctia plantaginis]|uniref:RNA-directed DNA polymerase n=1 Tax=Arctia plantaginis TaxID=874455 RepID=A0A8S0ZLQ5_ARCPL|nr:unnamed protein product [Arctia plantaginis]